MSQHCFAAYQQDTGELVDICFGSDVTLDITDHLGDDPYVTGVLETSFRDVDTLWFLVAGAMVLFMQVGFAMLEVGAVDSKNVHSMLVKHVMDICLVALISYVFGWGFAYGINDDPNELIGSTDFLIDETNDFRGFFFHWVRTATVVSIVSGSVVERLEINAYFIYTIAIAGFVYPVVVYWVWSGEGWLSNGKEMAMIDYAGSGVVHMVGGICGLVGAVILDSRPEFPKRSIAFQVFGTLMLWFGWYGFNCGSSIGVVGQMDVAARVAVSTSLAAAAGGITTLFLNRFVAFKYDVVILCSGILAGLVSISAGCATVGTGSALAIGSIGGVLFMGSRAGIKHYEIDDPLEAFSIHGVCGLWGILAAGIWSEDALVELVYGAGFPTYGERLGNQLVGAVAIFMWSIMCGFVVFGFLFTTLAIPVERKKKHKSLLSSPGDAGTWNVQRLSWTGQLPPGQQLMLQELHRSNEFHNSFERLCLLIDKDCQDHIEMDDFQRVCPVGSDKLLKNIMEEEEEIFFDGNLLIIELRQLFALENGKMDLDSVEDLIAEAETQKQVEFNNALTEFLELLDVNYESAISKSDLKEMCPMGAVSILDQLGEDIDLTGESLETMFELDDEMMDIDRLQALVAEAVIYRRIQFDDVFADLCMLVDINFDAVFSVTEFAALCPVGAATIFENLDTNKDDKLSATELSELFVLANGAMDVQRVENMIKEIRLEKARQFDEKFTELCALADANGNGIIDAEEFHTICPLGAETVYEDLDINRDGKVQFDELRSLFILADGTMDVPRVHELLIEIKINQDNERVKNMNFKELKDYARSVGIDVDHVNKRNLVIALKNYHRAKYYPEEAAALALDVENPVE